MPFMESRPSAFLFFSSIAIVLIGFYIPFSPLAENLGFVKPPISFYVALFFISSSYFLLVQVVKTWFVKRFGLV